MYMYYPTVPKDLMTLFKEIDVSFLKLNCILMQINRLFFKVYLKSGSQEVEICDFLSHECTSL